jgi:hypothetical protein
MYGRCLVAEMPSPSKRIDAITGPVRCTPGAGAVSRRYQVVEPSTQTSHSVDSPDSLITFPSRFSPPQGRCSRGSRNRRMPECFSRSDCTALDTPQNPEIWSFGGLIGAVRRVSESRHQITKLATLKMSWQLALCTSQFSATTCKSTMSAGLDRTGDQCERTREALSKPATGIANIHPRSQAGLMSS